LLVFPPFLFLMVSFLQKKKKENVEKTLQLSDQFDINQNNIFFVCVNVFMVLNKIKTEQKKQKETQMICHFPWRKEASRKKKLLVFPPFLFLMVSFLQKKKKGSVMLRNQNAMVTMKRTRHSLPSKAGVFLFFYNKLQAQPPCLLAGSS